MKYKIAICDDLEEDRQSLSNLSLQWAKEANHSVELSTFSSAENFLFHYVENSDFDILLLDVEMNTMSGIELAKHIRKNNHQVEIIFITSHFEFISEGYEVDALHYLGKPIRKEKLLQVLSKAAEKLSITPPSILITCDGETIKLYETDILYVESFLHYLSIHTKTKEYKIKESMTAFENKLSDTFFRIHRSYLVSLKAITKISRTCVTIEGMIELPVARGKYDEINRAFIEHN